MKTLYVIPARGGSKGIARKNIKLLGGKPLILWTIDLARSIADDCDICVTSDDDEIIDQVLSSGLHVPFTRPHELATDTAGTRPVLIHALDHYESLNIFYDTIVLLQPTSPFRERAHVLDCLSIYRNSLPDMVVSVKTAEVNPYYDLFEEDARGYLKKSKPASFTRRQDCPPVYQYNGSIYVLSTSALRASDMSDFKKITKYVMPRLWSVDIDTPLDWLIAEAILENHFLYA